MPPSWKPDATDVAGPLHARTLGGNQAGSDGYGALTGGFDATTTIPDTKVTAAIDLVLPEVIAIVGDDSDDTDKLDEPCAGLAKQLTVFLAAADLEAGTYPRQTSRDQTANDYWIKRAERVEKRLREAYADLITGDTPGPADDIAASAGLVTHGFGAYISRNRIV